MIEWSYIIIGLSALLLTFLLWQEAGRKNKARLTWRVIATIVAVLTFACLALPITYNKTDHAGRTNEAILITEGYNNDSIKSFLHKNGNNRPVITTDENVSSSNANASYISDLSLLNHKYPRVEMLHVFGYGLNSDELTSLEEKPVIFHPVQAGRGITSVSWPSKIKAGEKFRLQGSFNNASASNATIVLRAFNTMLDSLSIAPDKSGNFELVTIPKHLGRNVYSLSVINKGDTIEKAPVPLEVVQGQPLKVLLLASSPDFENKFLKNWLGENGYKVAIRTTISKNKFDKEFLNLTTISLDRITSALLSNFDVAVADATELSTISATELTAIKASVSVRGMGLIIRSDSAASNTFYSRLFPVVSAKGHHQQTLHARLIDSTIKLPALNIEAPSFIQSVTGTQPFVFDQQNRILISGTLFGSGKIVFTTLANTFSWALSGNNTAYAELWSEILNKAADKSPNEESWSVSPNLPRVDDPVQIHLESNSISVPTAEVAGSAVYLKQDATLPYKWSGTYWPVKEGWQPTIQLNGEIFWWYAYSKNDWKNVYAAEKIEATRHYASTHPYQERAGQPTLTSLKVEFPKIYFLLVFIIACAYLWLEIKLLV